MEFFLSQIINMPVNHGVRGLMKCDGRTLSIKEHEPLFALLGTRFGGDGINTFAIPDLRPWGDAGPDYGKRIRRDWHEDEVVSFMCVEGIWPSYE